MAVQPARKRRSLIQTPLFLKEVPTQAPAPGQPAAIPLAEAGTFLEDLVEAAEFAYCSQPAVLSAGHAALKDKTSSLCPALPALPQLLLNNLLTDFQSLPGQPGRHLPGSMATVPCRESSCQLAGFCPCSTR